MTVGQSLLLRFILELCDEREVINSFDLRNYIIIRELFNGPLSPRTMARLIFVSTKNCRKH